MRRPTSRPFVVEVKRGSKRSFFNSVIQEIKEKGEPEKKPQHSVFSEPKKSKSSASESSSRTGRVLPVVKEPPPMVFQVDEAPPLTSPEPDEPAPLPKRRGRKPGSTNRPKVDARVASEANERAPRAEKMVPRPDPMPVARSTKVEAVAALDADNAAASGEPRRLRFRERSMILKRYVLQTEPPLGMGWSRRLKRK